MVRQAIMAAVLKAATRETFNERSDFRLSDGLFMEGSTPIDTLVIQYLPGERSSMRITFREPNRIETEEDPGPIGSPAQNVYGSLSELYGAVGRWSDRAWEDIAAGPIFRQIQQHEQQIGEILSQYENLSDGYFTKEEGDRLRAEMDYLHTRLEEVIRASELSEDEEQRRLAEVQKDIAQIKARIDTSSRPGWVGTLVSRMRKYTDDPTTRKALGDGTVVVGRVVGEIARQVGQAQLPPPSV